MWRSQVKGTTSIEDVIHSKGTEAMSEKRVKFAKKEHSEFSHWTHTKAEVKVNQNWQIFTKMKIIMMKDASDWEVFEEKEKDQFAKLAKMKS